MNFGLYYLESAESFAISHEKRYQTREMRGLRVSSLFKLSGTSKFYKETNFHSFNEEIRTG